MDLTFEDLPRAMSEMMRDLKSIKEKVFNNSHIEPLAQEESDIMNTKECAEYLKVTIPTIYNYVNRGAIPYFKVGNKKYFKKSVIDKAFKVK